MVISKPSEERHVYKGRREMLQIAKQSTNQQARAAIRTAFCSGMRMGEILRAIPTKDGSRSGTRRTDAHDSFRSIPELP
ncbi:hypothetical protein [Burkholderia ubonensis]|uniref:hypothetical protein n=1 Tax=Burkholderia ubonensis TaxID=101571 RepID=UPI001E44D046|nr:hypothetical protein [Burkholderia ubonensis]